MRGHSASAFRIPLGGFLIKLFVINTTVSRLGIAKIEYKYRLF